MKTGEAPAPGPYNSTIIEEQSYNGKKSDRQNPVPEHQAWLFCRTSSGVRLNGSSKNLKDLEDASRDMVLH